jgi:eukaryotic-like serine/threonine-protein kinase
MTMTGRKQALCVVFFAIFQVFSIAQDASMFRGGLNHSGYYLGKGVPSFSGIKWTFHTKGQVTSSPAIADGVVYVASTDGNMYAIDQQSGSLRWKFSTEARIPSSPAVAKGVLYFGSYDGNFYAIDARNGKLKWKARSLEHRFAAKHLHGSLPADETMPDPFDVYLSSPAVWNDSVYFGSGDGNVYSLDANSGAQRWKFRTGDVVHASPAIADGRLYIGSWDSYFYALDAETGKELWRFKTGEDDDIHNQVGIQSSATVVNGLVYFGCRDSKFYALDAGSGKQRWVFPNQGSWVITSPVVHDGIVYFATSDTALFHALDAQTGSPVYSIKFHWPVFSSPAIAGSTLYLASQDGKLTAIDLNSRQPAWVFQTDASRKHLPELSKADGAPNYDAVFDSNFYDDLLVGIGKLHAVGTFLSSPVISGDVLYIGSSDGNLYALR